ncbi:uncharacterized protein LOC126665740 [Mercurialis annua]|uniref:uncharacterized protein LOC126665740 n=1 Tax=Mercurialis annua TaxID=3986 RepID=UPI002160B275|nr:uncharacterized protein LOC126665740 [Mercurialis annua]
MTKHNYETSTGSSAVYSEATSSEFNAIPQKHCCHDVAASVYTAYTKGNPGRRFYRCKFREHDDCNFFEWIDPEVTGRERKVMTKLIDKRDALEEALKVKTEAESKLRIELQSNTCRMTACRGLLGVMNRKVEEADRKNLELQQTVNEMAEMNSRVGKQADKLGGIKAKLLQDKRSLQKRNQVLMRIIWFIIMLLVIVSAISFNYCQTVQKLLE